MKHIGVVLLAFVFANADYAARELFAAPKDRQTQGAWLKSLREWRNTTLEQINYTADVYDDISVNWTRLSVVQPQTHLFDRYLYNPENHTYTVDRYLADIQYRYGGIDSILLWPTYPNIGIDSRNQFDLFRATPGGLGAIRKLTSEFKARGIRVLWAYNPWDQGTRDEGEPPWTTLVKLLKETGGDGFNGDTMITMYRQFWEAGLSSHYHIAGEMQEGGYPRKSSVRPEDKVWDSAQWEPMGWGEFMNGDLESGLEKNTSNYAMAMGIDKLKWLDGRRMTHVCDRWAKNRTDSLQLAFFNGIGYESWENVWGMFMSFTQRDGEALRRIATLLRWLARQQFTQGFEDWEPYTSDLLRDPTRPFAMGGLIASKFMHKSGDCVWLVVNRGSSFETDHLDTTLCGQDGLDIYDLYRGQFIGRPRPILLSVEPHGYAAILVTGRQLPLASLLAKMQRLTETPLNAFSAHWEPLPQKMVGMAHMVAAGTKMLDDMVLIPQTAYRFQAAGVELEGGCEHKHDSFGVCCTRPPDGPKALNCPHDPECATPCAFYGADTNGVDARFPWEAQAHRFHDHIIEVGPFYIDKHLVTKGSYAKFLRESGSYPRDPYNFLVGWQRNQDGMFMPAVGEELQPVVWISLEEARAYCAWAGKRLPHVYEWQVAAQGTDDRLYPWGNELSGAVGVRFPNPFNGTFVPPLPNVGAYSPAGDSPHGVADLVGLVWQYTDEFRDAHTRTVLLKGSSLYTPMLSDKFPSLPQVGNWYFPKALQVNRHNRMMLMDDSYERAATLGFRCVADHSAGQDAPYHYRDLSELGPDDSAGILYS